MLCADHSSEGLVDVVAIASGGSHGLALSRDGHVTAWGDNTYGQTSVPSGLDDVRGIAAGPTHSLALRSNGTVVAWGSNLNGQTNVPAELDNVIAIDAGGDTSFALRSDGSAAYWGMYASGGVETIYVPGFRIVDIAVGDTHLAAVFDDGEMGGHSIDLANAYKPVPPPRPLPYLTSVSAGSGFILGLSDKGTVVAWGRNDYGQCAPPTELEGVREISAGGSVALALADDGVIGWGTAVVATGLTDVIAIAAGELSLALRQDGSIVSWSNTD